MMMKRKKLTMLLVVLLAALGASGQSSYCLTYEDFVANKWTPLDTVCCDQHSKSHQAWWGGNDFTLTTGQKATDKILKKEAFVVMQGDTMYINCRNLRLEKARFNGGYTRAMRIGNRSILFVNKRVEAGSATGAAMAGIMFGAIGGAVVAGIAAGGGGGKQVCYVVSSGADAKGRIAVRLIDDSMVSQMLIERDDLLGEYYAEPDAGKRILASRVVPLLEKAGLFKQQQ